MTKFNCTKKILASAVTVSAVAFVAVPGASADTSGFTDVSPTYAEAVDFLVSNGITYGKNSNIYGTDDKIKRSDAAVIIARSLGLFGNEAFEDAGFKDVPDRAKWAINALVEKNIINGFSATKFGSDENLTRNQMAKIIANAGQLEIDETSKVTQFKDVNANFAPFVEALVKSGITKGKTNDAYGSYDLFPEAKWLYLLIVDRRTLGSWNY